MPRIESLDDLYDFLHLNKGLPVKYILTKIAQSKGKPTLSLQNKLTRKFFYENSEPVDDLVLFGEIDNPRIAQKIGLTNKDQIVFL